MSTFRTLLAASLLAGLAACDSSTASSDDSASTPVDQTWASRQAGGVASSVDPSAVLDDSDLAMGGTDLDIPASAQTLVAGRALAAPQTTETLEGEWFVRRTTVGEWSRVDSIHILPADVVGRVPDDIRATEVVSRLQGPLVVQRSVLRDADGDGYVLGNASEERLVNLEVVRTRGDLKETALLRANSGADGNIFLDADNQVYDISWNRVRAGDTVRVLRLRPLGDDTLLSGDGKTSRLLAARIYHKGPFAVRKAEATVRVSGTDTVIVRIAGSVAWNNGREETFSVKDQAGGDVDAGDTAVLSHQVRGAAGDSEVVRSFQARVLPGTGLGRADNRMISIDGEIEHRTGRLVRTVFHLESSEGVLAGRTPATGSFSWVGTLREGGSVSLVGEFTPSGVRGTWTGPDGKTATVQP